MTPFILDMLALGALLFCTYQGFRKGLILSAAGLLVIFLAIWGGGVVAQRFQEPVTEMLTPVMGWITDDATDEAARGMGRMSDITAVSDVMAVAERAFELLGISKAETESLTDKVTDLMREGGITLRASISKVFLDTVVYVLLYLFGFAIVCILLTLLATFISAVFRLPGLHLLDKIGGAVLGLVYGFVFLFAVAFVLRFTGIVIDQEIITDSWLCDLFVNANPFSNVIL